MTTTSTDTMIFMASWLDPRPEPAPAPAASFPDGAGEDDDDDDDTPMTMSRRWPAGGHVMSGRRGFLVSGVCR